MVGQKWPADEWIEAEAESQRNMGFADTGRMLLALKNERLELAEQVKQLQGLIRFWRDKAETRQAEIDRLGHVLNEIRGLAGDIGDLTFRQ